MNILVISAWCPYPADNGSRLRAYHLLRELAARGHRLTLIALAQEDSDLDLAEEGLRPLCAGGVELFPSHWFRPNTLKSRLGFFSTRPRMLLDTYQAEAAVAIARECRSTRHEVALGLELGVAQYIPPDCAMPCALDQIEVSGFVRARDAATSRRARLRTGLMLAKFRAHAAQMARRFAVWTAVSEQEKQAILMFLGPKSPPAVEVLPNGVDLLTNTFEPGAAYAVDTLIYNGALSYSANDDAVRYCAQEILPRIRQQRPQAQLLVTGRHDCLASDDALRSTPGVTLTGYLKDIQPAVRGAAVCVVPLRQGGGSRLKILEAMALGTPVVATSRGAEGIDATNGAEILLADTPEEFAAAVLGLMNDPARRALIGAGGRHLVEARYGWNAIGAQLERRLQALCRTEIRETACP